MDILSQIQSDLIDHNVPLSDILRKAKVLASQLGSDELATWVFQELDGYEDFDSLPDYRVLKTAVSGTWTNGYWMVHNRGVTMISINDENLRRHLTTFTVYKGIRSVEQFTHMKEEEHFMVLPDTTAYVNTLVGEGGYGYTDLHYSLGPHDFEQILDTVRNRLLDFVLKLGKQWDPKRPPPTHEQVGKLVSVEIYNNPKGGAVTVFDQRGQQVHYQFNAAGDINVENVGSIPDLTSELSKLRAEIDRAKMASALPEETAIEAQHYLLQASREATSKNPSKENVVTAIQKATDLLKEIAALSGLVTALTELAEFAKSLFS